jgi:CMP/dCMP kinase
LKEDLKKCLKKNVMTSIEEVQNNLEMRDYIDSNREFSPLRKADDAKVLDNSNLTKDEQLLIALTWAKNAIND